MAIVVQIPPPLREPAGDRADVAVSGATVKAVLDDLVRQCPALGPKLFDNGKLRPHVNVLVNDEDVRYLQKLDTPVGEGDKISILPAVAGGA